MHSAIQLFVLLWVLGFSHIGGTSENWTHINTNSGLPDNDVRALLEDRSGNMWIGTRNGGIAVYQRQDSSWLYFTESDGLSANGILSLYQAGDGSIWAAGGAGYSTYNGGSWSKSDSVGGGPVRVAYTVSGEAGAFIGLAANGGASIYDGTGWQVFNQQHGLPHRVVHDVYRENANALWFACRQGLGYWDGESMQVLFEEENFRAIVKGQAGTIWFGTGGAGIYAYHEGDWENHLAGKTVLPKLIDQKGQLWAATEGAGAYMYDGERWHRYDAEDGLASNMVYSIAGAADGSLWFGTDAGVSIYTPE